MSIASEIERIKNNISSAYEGLQSKGVELPSSQNSENLRAAVDSLPDASGKMDLMRHVQDASQRADLSNGQLFKEQGDVGVTDSTAAAGYILFASKADLEKIPTKTSDLVNDSGFLKSQDISTKADKATSLSGYGITDAYTKAQVDALIPKVLTKTSELNNDSGFITLKDLPIYNGGVQ